MFFIIWNPSNGVTQTVQLSFTDANSLTDQALAYAESITKGDVLVRQTSLFEALQGNVDQKLPGIILEETMFYRAVFDFERDRFALYHLVDQEVDELAEQNPRNASIRSIYGVCYDSESSDQVNTSRFPGGPNRFSRSDFDKPTMAFLRGIQFRDCRYAFLGLGCKPLEDYYFLRMKRQQTGDTTVEVDHPDANSIEVLTAKPAPLMPEGWSVVRFHRRERYDIQSGFRVFAGDEGTFIVDGIEKVSNSSYTKLTVDWIKEIPVVVSGNSRRFRSVGHNGQEYQGPEKTRYEYFWISINQEIEDSLFDQTNLESAKKILALLDPEKLGAKKRRR